MSKSKLIKLKLVVTLFGVITKNINPVMYKQNEINLRWTAKGTRKASEKTSLNISSLNDNCHNRDG